MVKLYKKINMKQTFHFKLNGKPVSVDGENETFLLTVIRTYLEQTGTKFGCGIGQCGACTVLIDDAPERSCMVSLEDVEGKEITTIEGLSSNGDLHPLQKAFIEHDALQCGFCTPGMILNAYGLIKKNPEISREEIYYGMEENLCRCGSYNRIIDAIKTAASEMNEKVKL